MDERMQLPGADQWPRGTDESGVCPLHPAAGGRAGFTPLVAPKGAETLPELATIGILGSRNNRMLQCAMDEIAAYQAKISGRCS